MKLLIAFMIFNTVTVWAGASNQILTSPMPAQLRYTKEFILEQVLKKKKLSLRADIPVPEVLFESSTPLKRFQDAIEPQWGFRPDVYTNAYVVHLNEVFILDEAKFYEEKQRCMDDSLAHELTHFVQVKYQGWDLLDESLEWDAVEVQTWFRENFCKTKK